MPNFLITIRSHLNKNKSPKQLKKIEVKFKDMETCLQWYINKFKLTSIIPLTINKEVQQIRIPKDEYECLTKEITDVLFESCLKSDSEKTTLYANKDFYKTHFWEHCSCYIFEVEVIELQTNVVYGFDGVEDYGRSITFLEYKHPFIKEFVNSSEGEVWTKFGFDKKIRKYQHIDKVIVTQL